jgi:large subunit ribosomal protein L21e
MKHHGAFRRGTRAKLRKNHTDAGKISLRKFFQELLEGERVVLKAEPAYQKGMYYPRFHGRNGLVMKKRGNCYEVLIKDGDKDKLLVIHPIHLTRQV